MRNLDSELPPIPATIRCPPADPDLADEMVRKDLGLVRADEVVIPLE